MQIVEAKPIQVFISTQSIEVIALLTHHLQKAEEDLQEQLRVFRLELDNGCLVSAVFYFKNLYTWLKQGMDPRLWKLVDLPISYRYLIIEQPFAEEEV